MINIARMQYKDVTDIILFKNRFERVQTGSNPFEDIFQMPGWQANRNQTYNIVLSEMNNCTIWGYNGFIWYLDKICFYKIWK